MDAPSRDVKVEREWVREGTIFSFSTRSFIGCVERDGVMRWDRQRTVPGDKAVYSRPKDGRTRERGVGKSVVDSRKEAGSDMLSVE